MEETEIHDQRVWKASVFVDSFLSWDTFPPSKFLHRLKNSACRQKEGGAGCCWANRTEIQPIWGGAPGGAPECIPDQLLAVAPWPLRAEVPSCSGAHPTPTEVTAAYRSHCYYIVIVADASKYCFHLFEMTSFLDPLLWSLLFIV